MSIFPRLSNLSLYGGELHRKGGVLFKARLGEWERELQYLRFRIAEWKEFGSVEHPDYCGFRSFLLQKVRHHLHFELKTLSSILVACEVAAESEDVPPLPMCADALVAFRERISPGEITRRMHLEEWHWYSRVKEEDASDTPSDMDEMFARIRAEIGAMERRSAEFKGMVDELVRMVREMQDAFSSGSRDRHRGGGAGGIGFGIGFGLGNVNVNGSVNGSRAAAVRGSRLFAHFTHVPQGVTMRSGSRTRPRSRLVRSPSDLAHSRARLPPPLPASPAAAAAAAAAFTNGPGIPYPAPRLEEEASPGALPASGSVASRLWQRVAMAESASSPGLNTPARPPHPRPPSPRPATAPRDLHQRLFHRMFYTPQGANHPRPRTPSQSASTALGSAAPPSRSRSRPRAGSGTGSYEDAQEEEGQLEGRAIAETRTRLPPPPESPPIPYRPPQRLFSFLNRP